MLSWNTDNLTGLHNVITNKTIIFIITPRDLKFQHKDCNIYFVWSFMEIWISTYSWASSKFIAMTYGTVYFRELQDEGIQTTVTSYSEQESQSSVSKCVEVSEFNYSFTEFNN